MILDTGICSVFRETDAAQPGGMPRHQYALLTQSWYGELSFETSPARPTEGRQERRTDARIRIHQCREIRQNDIVALYQANALTNGAPAYRVTRAWHGLDDGGPTPVTDLSLEVYTP